MQQMKNLPVIRTASICAGIDFSLAALQQAVSTPGGQMNMSGSSDANASSSTRAFKAADESMMKNMSGSYTGDTDKDFVSHMIPHQQGAVDMAQVELRYGKDQEMKRLATNIVKAQKEEIAYMKNPVRKAFCEVIAGSVARFRSRWTSAGRFLQLSDTQSDRTATARAQVCFWPSSAELPPPRHGGRCASV